MNETTTAPGVSREIVESHSLHWVPGFNLYLGKGGAFLVAPQGQRIDHFTGDKADLLSQFWDSNGPQAEDAEEFLRTHQRLIYPLWNELLVDLAQLGAVDIPHDHVAGSMQAYETMIWKKLLPTLHLFTLPSPAAIIPFTVAVLGGMLSLGLFGSFLVPVLVSRKMVIGVDLLLQVPTLIAFVGTLAIASALLVWRTGGIIRGLLNQKLPFPAVELIAGVPVIRRNYLFVHLLSRKEKIYLGLSGFLTLGILFLPVAALLATGRLPQFALGAFSALTLLLLIDIVPLWNSDGAAFLEGLFAEKNLRKSIHSTILHQWMPRRAALSRSVGPGELRFLLLSTLSLILLILIAWALGVSQGLILKAPAVTLAAERLRLVWIAIWGIGFFAFLVLLGSFIAGLLIDYIRLVRPHGYRVIPMRERERVLALTNLSHLSITHGVGERLLGNLIENSRLLSVFAGHYIIREGEVGNSFFLLLEGELEVTVASPGGSPVKLARLAPGAGVGEVALLSNVPRTASVRALGQAILLSVGGPEFLAWLDRVGISRGEAADRIRISQVCTASPLLRELPPACIQQLVAVATQASFSAGNELIREGDEGNEFYILLKGTVSVQRRGSVLAELGAGSIVGEMALLSGKRRNASVFIKEDVEVLVIDAVDFWSILEVYPVFRAAAQALARSRRTDS